MATYDIYTLAQLQAISTGHLADDCVLHNDIDASPTRTWNETGTDTGIYQGFNPIASTGFTGTFEGNGYTISNLYINRPTQDRVGLFAPLAGSGGGQFVRNLNIFNADITGEKDVGILASFIDGTGTTVAITDVSVSGSITFAGTHDTWGVGGLAGGSINGVLIRCHAVVEISAATGLSISQQHIGGLLGTNAGSCANCSADGSISVTLTASSTVNIGGFAGRAGSATDTSITSCSATGDITANVTGTTVLGGFIGTNGSSDAITKCFAYGNVSSLSASRSTVGGFIGLVGAGSAALTQCGAEGNVENLCTTNNKTGGFVGQVSLNGIANCYAHGTVCLSGINDASANIGGFAGTVDVSTDVVTCYSTGEVYSPATNGGGFAGVVGTGTACDDCYWDTETSNWATSAGSATGKNTTQMKTEATFVGWNFTTVWLISTFTRSPGASNTIWLSETSDYENFEVGVKDADSFALTIPTTNTIRWIEGVQSLLVGTSGDEWRIGSNKLDTSLTPTNFAVKRQTRCGGANIQPIKINEAVLFVDYVGRKIRELVPKENDASQFIAPDMTALAEHITYSGITSIAIQRNPDTIIWATLADGSLVSMVYDREQNVVAWSKHPLRYDEYLYWEDELLYYENEPVIYYGHDVIAMSVCVIPAASEDEIWLSLGRIINGAEVTYLEKFASRTFTDIEDAFFVDSGLTVTSATSTTSVTTLGHLIGETVYALADGVVQGPFKVDANGDITLTTAAKKIQIGLPYRSKLQPMNPAVGQSQSAIVRVPEMGLSFVNSKNIKSGTEDYNLYDVDFTDSKWTNKASIAGLFTGTVMVAVDGGYSIENNIIISTDAPLPCTLLAMFPRQEQTSR